MMEGISPSARSRTSQRTLSNPRRPPGTGRREKHLVGYDLAADRWIAWSARGDVCSSSSATGRDGTWGSPAMRTRGEMFLCNQKTVGAEQSSRGSDLQSLTVGMLMDLRWLGWGEISLGNRRPRADARGGGGGENPGSLRFSCGRSDAECSNNAVPGRFMTTLLILE